MVEAGLKLLDEHGLDGLTLGLIAKELNVRAPTLYWRFSSKQDLIDEMATAVIADWVRLLPDRPSADWVACAQEFATSFRASLKARRDGARLIAGTHLKDNVLLRPLEGALRVFEASGIAVGEAILCIKTLYDYVLGFTIEEQAIKPIAGERDPRYDLASRPARIGEGDFALSIEAGPHLLGSFEDRFSAGVRIIIDGFRSRLTVDPRPSL